jgi:hypothetical protein
LEINDRKLDVKIASPKENRPPRKEVQPKPAFKKSPGGFRPGNARPGGNAGRTGSRDNFRKKD